MHEKQVEPSYVRIKNNALSEIEILENEIQSAISKQNEAAEKKETEAVMKAIQRNVDFFKQQISELQSRIKATENETN